MGHQEAVQLHAAARQFLRMGQIDRAIELLTQAARNSPAFLQVHSELADLLISTRRRSDAAQHLTAALTINRGWVDGHAKLGAVLAEMGQHELASEQFRHVIRLRPTNIDALNDLGTMLKSLKRFSEAVEVLQKAAHARPDDSRIRLNLGTAFHMNGQIAEGLTEFDRAIELDAKNTALRVSHGNAMVSAGRLHDAIEAYTQAAEIDPTDSALHSQLMMALLYTDAANTDLQQFVDEGARFNQRHIAPLPRTGFTNIELNQDRRLRVGYLSADFRLHSVAFFIEPLLANHDPAQFEIFCYADVSRPDAVTERLQNLVPNWNNVFGKTDQEIAEQIRRDRIDILIDLAGHSAGNRLKVFGRKPAPLQASYLGFPHITGVSTIDYRITDNIADPPIDRDDLITEKLFRLDAPFICYSPAADAPEPGPLPASSIGHITFGSFNNLPKLSAGTLALWSSAMNSVPNSRMLIKAPDLHHEQIHGRLITQFESHGITRDRLLFLGFEKNTSSHLTRYQQIDIALDSFPYNGTTTTCEALWMGVPVVTLAGRVHSSRVGASLLTSIGHEEWIARATEEFSTIAATLAADFNNLANLRNALREKLRTSSLMDGPRFAKKFEAALRTMWQSNAIT